MKEFRKRQTRQIIAVAMALFLVLLAAVIWKRPDIFGEFSPEILFSAQAIVIAAFIGFTSANWRCPSCNKHLGGDINRGTCGKCGARLR
jgi:hypothetical protein